MLVVSAWVGRGVWVCGCVCRGHLQIPKMIHVNFLSVTIGREIQVPATNIQSWVEYDEIPTCSLFSDE